MFTLVFLQEQESTPVLYRDTRFGGCGTRNRGVTVSHRIYGWYDVDLADVASTTSRSIGIETVPTPPEASKRVDATAHEDSLLRQSVSGDLVVRVYKLHSLPSTCTCTCTVRVEETQTQTSFSSRYRYRYCRFVMGLRSCSSFFAVDITSCGC